MDAAIDGTPRRRHASSGTRARRRASCSPPRAIPAAVERGRPIDGLDGAARLDDRHGLPCRHAARRTAASSPTAAACSASPRSATRSRGAVASAYDAVSRIGWQGMHYRGDIGHRAVGRCRGAAVLNAAAPGTVDGRRRRARGGWLVVFPTETVYGLGADACSPAAVARLVAVRGREAGKPILVLVARPRDGGAGEPRAVARRRAVSRSASGRARSPSCCPRVPACPSRSRRAPGRSACASPPIPTARALVAGLGAPVTAPSANPPGAEPPRALAAARAYFGDAVDVYLDGGTLAGGASTVAAVDGDRVRVLRAGPVREERAAGRAGGCVMAVVSPFRALRYDPARVGDLGRRGGAALRRDLAGAAGRALRAQPVERRAAHPAARARRAAGGRGGDAARLDGVGRAGARCRAGALLLLAGVLAARRLAPSSRRRALPSRARGVRDRRRAAARAHLPRSEGRSARAAARDGRLPEPDLRALRARPASGCATSPASRARR